MDIVASVPAASESSTTAGLAMSSSSPSTAVPATAPTAAVVAAAIASRSLRVRTSSQSGGRQAGEALNEIQLCPSAMSEGTRKMLPPTTETIQTKPFPIRGELGRRWDHGLRAHGNYGNDGFNWRLRLLGVSVRCGVCEARGRSA
uniref:Uncharacterized protein n=1 Tax=Anopheles triannulatus TaxID=58253 RepID=A0A2M4ALU6_9DIPT